MKPKFEIGQHVWCAYYNVEELEDHLTLARIRINKIILTNNRILYEGYKKPAMALFAFTEIEEKNLFVSINDIVKYVIPSLRHLEQSWRTTRENKNET